MGKYKVEIQPTAEKDLSKHKKSGNKNNRSENTPKFLFTHKEQVG
jgi:hypothetical protein